jgi:uncharacterized protein (DUF58 family)
MRRIVRRPLWEQFQADVGVHVGVLAGAAGDIFYTRRRFFNPAGFAVFVLLVLTGMGMIWGRPAWVLLVTFAVVLGWFAVATERLARGIHLVRGVPRRGAEREEVEIRWEVRNTTALPVWGWVLEDRTTASRTTVWRGCDEAGVRPFSVRRGSYRVRLDAGMGEFRFAPMQLTLSDPFGIFRWTVVEDEPSVIEVMPEEIVIPRLELPPTFAQSGDGLEERPVPGGSSNLLGVREYVRGDPVSRIHWKLSARLREFVVKEFENTVSTDVTLWLDFGAGVHLGKSDRSTWEALKDVSLAVLAEIAPGVQQIQVRSQELRLPFGRGPDHLQWATQRISRLEPVEGPCGDEALRAAIADLPFGSLLIYAGPVYGEAADPLPATFELLRERGVRVVCILLAGHSWGEAAVREELTVADIAVPNSESERSLTRLVRKLGALEIPTYTLALDQPIPQAFLAPASSRSPGP